MKHWAWLILVLLTTALAHSYLIRSSPSAGQTVKVMPKSIQLEFSEPLEVNFSNFKVYALPPSNDPQSAAAEFSAKVLPIKSDAEARADLGLVSAASPAAKLELKLKEKLPRGWYVVMYRVLSVDGHITTGQWAFKYQ